jgi:hypothetical protein
VQSNWQDVIAASAAQELVGARNSVFHRVRMTASIPLVFMSKKFEPLIDDKRTLLFEDSSEFVNRRLHLLTTSY